MEEATPEHVKIDTIKIVINGLVVEMKVGQARSLWSELNELFGPRPAAPVYIPWYIPSEPFKVPSPWIDQPIYVNPNTEPFPDKWQVTCNAYAGNSLVLNQ